jgi:hypothetical protein
MTTQTPYRALPTERRVALVEHAIRASRESRQLFVQRLAALPGGFRLVTLQSWSPDKLAREVVRRRAEKPEDEIELLQLLYIELEPATQITFFDAAGVAHEAGRLAEDAEPPYADADAVRRAVAAVVERHGADGMHYLQTLARYARDGWPGIEEVVGQLDAGAE